MQVTYLASSLMCAPKFAILSRFMKKNTNIKICNETIHPGEKLSMALPLPQLFSCAPMYMPLKIVHGKIAGPCLLITAAMHGDEINGTEIINQLLNMTSLSHLRGTLIAAPVLNVYGLISKSRYLPGGIDLDRSFPGEKDGKHAERLTHLFVSEILSMANYCIDLQTGPMNYTNLPQIFINQNDHSALTLAEAFNPPVILNDEFQAGSLRAQAGAMNLPFLMYEAGEAMRFDDYAIKTGIKGILNVMRKLEMLPERSHKKEKRLRSLYADQSSWVFAPTSGIAHSQHALGHHIKKGDVLSIIKDPFGANDDVKVHSPCDGIIVGKNNLPLVHEGESLFQIATFTEIKHAASQLEAWQEETPLT